MDDVCIKHLSLFKIKKNGVIVEVLVGSDSHPYYKMAMDLYQCAFGCQITHGAGMKIPPYDKDYLKMNTDYTVHD